MVILLEKVFSRSVNIYYILKGVCITGLQDFEALNSSEINDFRFKMRKIGDDISRQRYQGTWKEKLLYQYPPQLAKIHSAIIESFSDVKLIRVETVYALDNIKPDKVVLLLYYIII